MEGCRIYLAFAALVVVLEASGQPYFSKTYQGFNFSGGSITPDSGLVVSGANKLLRVDRNGTPLWATTYTTLTGVNVWINDVTWVGDSSFVYVGRAMNPGGTSTAMVQQVVNASGVPVWGGQLDMNMFDGDELFRAERAPDGSVVVCGRNSGPVTSSGYAVRLGSTAGSYSTPLRSSPIGSPNVAFIRAVRPTNDGGFIGVGVDGSLLVAYKVTATGTIAWSRSMPIGDPYLSDVHAVEGDAGSTYIATATLDDFFRLIHLNAGGSVEWSRKYALPGYDQPTDMVRFSNGDLWISGLGWLMACSASGDVLWARSLPHAALEMEIALEGDGVFLIGSAGNDGWIMRTDINGRVAGCGDDTLVPIVEDEALLATQHGWPTPVVDLGSNGVNFIAGTMPGTATECMATAVTARGADARELNAYPIPFTELLTVELPATHDRVALIDARGAIQRSVRTSNQRSIVLHRQGLASGLYLLRVMDANTPIAVQRVIVE